MPPRNIHATAILLGDRGILIMGDSGSGKSTLALALVREFARAGRFARLVGDDQLFLETRHGRLLARAPAPVAGVAEVHGLGPRPFGHEAAAAIDLVVRLVPAPDAPRFQENRQVELAGCSLPAIDLQARNLAASLAAILSWLAPFHGEA